MQHRYESQPFQIARQINNFSPVGRRSGLGLMERKDFNNIPIVSHLEFQKERPQKPSIEQKETDKNRTSYLNAPLRKIWESDWTLLIPETHKENGSIF